MGAWLAALVPGLGTVVLAVLSGAGGSALLELYWKPRAERRRAAALLHADVILNMQMIRLAEGIRKDRPFHVPEDLKLSTLGFDTAGALVGTLPAEMLRDVVLLYTRVQDANRNVDLYSAALDKYDMMTPNAHGRGEIEAYMDAVVDVLNTGLESTFESCRRVGLQVEKLAGVKFDKHQQARDFDSEARALLEGRSARTRALADMRKRDQTSE